MEGLTFFVVGSSTDETRREISLRMAFAATPVVAVLKSKWLVPRTRALKGSESEDESDMVDDEESI